jgi:UDP-N-acetylmuramate--alanine ligase
VVSTPQSAAAIPADVDLVVYTIAIPDSNEELAEARRREVMMKTYPEALGDITKEKETIAICGTHGKTTTTAMVYHALRACGVSPSVIVGSLLADKGTNYIQGDSKYLIVEACEYKRSFLNLHPTHVIVTNIDEDHLDYYKDINDIYAAFSSFVSHIPEDGTLVTHSDVSLQSAGRTVHADEVDRDSITLSVLGAHNRSNAQLVLALLMSLGFDEEKIREGLLSFTGTWRRMEYKGVNAHGVPVYDDYGHHPEEIKASIQAIKEKYNNKKLVMYFQPHLYSRTKALFDDFVTVLKETDMVYILPIYRAREEGATGVSEQDLAYAITEAGGNAAVCTFDAMKQNIVDCNDTNAVIINMGAGNAFEILNHITLTT